MRRSALILVSLVAVIPNRADATYSIVATDKATLAVGGSGTSCVGSLSVSILLGTAPGIGAIHAQAQVNTQGRDRGAMDLMNGMSPDEVIADITAPAFDFSAATRQYGVADVMGRAAGYSGAATMAYSDDLQGTGGDFTYSIQGNILTGAAVLEQAEAAFNGGGGCDLPDRLMLALEAGADNGEGDSRCTPYGIPSDSAFLRVVDENGDDIVFLDVTDTAPDNPLVELRAQYDAWRASHPCPMVGETDSDGASGTDEGGSTGGDETSGGGATSGTTGSGSGTTGGSTSTGGTSATTGTGTSTTTGGTTATGTSDEGGEAGEGGTAGGTEATGGEDSDGGCSCRGGNTVAPWRLLGLAIVPVVRRRQRADRR